MIKQAAMEKDKRSSSLYRNTVLLQRKCSFCPKKKRLIQLLSADQRGQGMVPPIVHEVLRSPSLPLDKENRAFFEPMFGHDFSRVRIHADYRAAESTRAVNAQAYTVGDHIALGVQDIKAQKSLLAHELVHVIQQQGHSGFLTRWIEIGSADDHMEQEADRVANRIISGHTQEGGISSPIWPTLQRSAITVSPSGSCGGFENFLMKLFGINPNLYADIITCGCLEMCLLDYAPLIGQHPVVEMFDCLCNFLSTLGLIHTLGSDGGCFDPSKLSKLDKGRIAGMAALTALDCKAFIIGPYVAKLMGLIGAASGSTSGPGGTIGGGIAGLAIGAVIGDMVVDFYAFGLQNLVTQGTFLPKSQEDACNRLISRVGSATPSSSGSSRRPKPSHQILEKPPASYRR